MQQRIHVASLEKTAISCTEEGSYIAETSEGPENVRSLEPGCHMTIVNAADCSPLDVGPPLKKAVNESVERGSVSAEGTERCAIRLLARSSTNVCHAPAGYEESECQVCDGPNAEPPNAMTMPSSSAEA